jgi:hypothetical protein
MTMNVGSIHPFTGQHLLVSRLKTDLKTDDSFKPPFFSLLLTDFFHLQTIPATTTDADQIQLAIRSAIQLLSKESFINDHGSDLADTLDYYEELERELTPYVRRQNDLQQVLQGCLYLPTRCLIIKTLVRYRSLDFDLVSA